jgi:hypothetical protein
MVMTQPNQHAGPSSSANRSQTMSPRSALPTEPTHVQAIHDFDPTQLASTSASNMNMYLAFYAGEILRVHVRDATGWWDGEIASVNDTGDPEPRKGPRRGWFPSNYVREMGWVWVSSISRHIRIGGRISLADNQACASQERLYHFSYLQHPITDRSYASTLVSRL